MLYRALVLFKLLNLLLKLLIVVGCYMLERGLVLFKLSNLLLFKLLIFVGYYML